MGQALRSEMLIPEIESLRPELEISPWERGIHFWSSKMVFFCKTWFLVPNGDALFLLLGCTAKALCVLQQRLLFSWRRIVLLQKRKSRTLARQHAPTAEEMLCRLREGVPLLPEKEDRLLDERFPT